MKCPRCQIEDLIEVQAQSETDIDVQLRNPEHDLTRSIKKVLHSYQAGGNLFDTVKGELTFNAYVSTNDQLPEQLVEFRESVEEVLNEVSTTASGRLTVNFIDPDANNGEVGQMIAQEYGFKPMATSLFSDQQFYFYLTLKNEQQVVQIPLDDLTGESFQRNLEAGIKLFASGFTKTVALVTPPRNYSMPGADQQSFAQLENFLGAELNVVRENLSDGSVSGQADILFLAAPKDLDEKQPQHESAQGIAPILG